MSAEEVELRFDQRGESRMGPVTTVLSRWPRLARLQTKLIVPYAATLIYCLTLDYLRGGGRRNAKGDAPGKDAS